MRSLVYVDIETTGLDPELHDVFEVAWAVNDGPVESMILPHTLAGADAEALVLNGYLNREIEVVEPVEVADIVEFMAELQNVTIVGSNPAFDTSFLRKKLGGALWHHRLRDVACAAQQEFGWPEPRGLGAIREHLVGLDYQVIEPDHTAVKDVEATRDVDLILRDLALERTG